MKENQLEYLVSKNPEILTNTEMPEDNENFEGQNILVIGGSDGHGVSMAVTTAQYLEKRGATVNIYVGSPVIRKGIGATHPASFYTKTIPQLDIEGYDRLVITDIPLDSKKIENLEYSQKAISELDKKIQENRENRGLPPVNISTFYIDHHSTTKFQELSKTISVKIVNTAEACKLGNEKTTAGRIGAICDRDENVLPITEEEMILAKGLDVAIRPDPDQQRPTMNEKDSTEAEKEEYTNKLTTWENQAQKRLEEAVRRLKNEDWEYFKKEAKRVERFEIPTISGFGQIAIVDTQAVTHKIGVLKLMEMALENSGITKTPYAIAILRELGDQKMNREPSDTITIIRHWTRNDLPSVEEIITNHFGAEFIKQSGIYGAENAKTVRLPINDRKTAKAAAQFIRAFAGQEIPDFSRVRSAIICGDPNSGKSVYSTIIRESLKNLGIKVAHLDLDKAAPTPQWYLDTENNFAATERNFLQNKVSQEELDSSKAKLKIAAEKRQSMKHPWSIELAEEAKQELINASKDNNFDFIIGDIGGGKIKKDENGKIVKITRLTPENAKILEGTDAVFIISNNSQSVEEWRKLIETGIDPETGVQIHRDKPIQIIGAYHSILEGSLQESSIEGQIGVITNLDRSKAEKKYNPTIFATALFISEAVEAKKKYITQALSNLQTTSRTANGIIDVSTSEDKKDKMVKNLTPNEISSLSTNNFIAALNYLYENREKKFYSPQQLREFVETIAKQINSGITKENILIREGTYSTKYPYTKTTELETAMAKFYTELLDRLNDPTKETEENAAFVEYHIDILDHFFADGCGKVAKAISAWILMQKNLPLPHYTSREEYYTNAKWQDSTGNVDLDKQKHWEQWLKYYKSFFQEV
jgi:hypothetical protein